MPCKLIGKNKLPSFIQSSFDIRRTQFHHMFHVFVRAIHIIMDKHGPSNFGRDQFEIFSPTQLGFDQSTGFSLYAFRPNLALSVFPNAPTIAPDAQSSKEKPLVTNYSIAHTHLVIQNSFYEKYRFFTENKLLIKI